MLRYYRFVFLLFFNLIVNSSSSNMPTQPMPFGPGHNYNHSLDGIVVSTGREFNNTVYLDLNHNSKLDIGEPNMSTDEYFYFDNLQPGNYIVRQTYMSGCYGILPNIFGYTDPLINENRTQIHHIAYINDIDFFASNHKTIYGGECDDMTRYDVTHHNHYHLLSNLDYLTDYDNNTFVSFRSDDYLIVRFSNNTIIDGDGYDIEFILMNNTDLSANISISTLNNLDLTYLGVLNNTNRKFDLSSINYTYPVNHIHIKFYGDTTDTMYISSIIGDYTMGYVPYNGFYIQVPFNNSITFIQECEYLYACEDYCDTTMYSWDSYISCNMGCIMAIDDITCPCDSTDPLSADYAYHYAVGNTTYIPTIFNTEDCYSGCEYRINKEIYPRYTYGVNGYAPVAAVMGQGVGCTTLDCIRSIKRQCWHMNCTSFSINRDQETNVVYYNTHQFQYDNTSVYFVRSKLLDNHNLEYMTYAPMMLSIQPTTEPSMDPTTEPSMEPTTEPTTLWPTPGPTTLWPTSTPTPGPTTLWPTSTPTPGPTTLWPTSTPTPGPTTLWPTSTPTLPPTQESTTWPSGNPTGAPISVDYIVDRNNENNSSSDTTNILLYIIAVISIVLLCILVYVLYKKRNHNIDAEDLLMRDQRLPPSFSNPLYNIDNDNESSEV